MVAYACNLSIWEMEAGLGTQLGYLIFFSVGGQMTGLDSECVVSCPAHQLLHLLMLIGLVASPVLWEYPLVIHTFGISLFQLDGLAAGAQVTRQDHMAA